MTGLSELAVKVEKDWVHMDKVEYEKLEWMKDLPKPQAGDSQVSFTLFRPMECSIKCDSLSQDGPLSIYIGVTDYISIKYCFSLKLNFILANSADPDEMLRYAAFIWVFTVCQSTHFGVSILQRVNP